MKARDALFFDASTRLIGSRGSRDALALRRVRAPVEPVTAELPPLVPAEEPVEDSGFELGVRDIRRTDPGWDPRRFAGYAAMVFRAAHRAWAARDVTALRDRVTPEMYAELQARCDALAGPPARGGEPEPEITAEVTEAWQEGGRDYLTAYIAGSMLGDTVEEYWTFRRPSGLNFWMLAAIQTS